MDKDLKHAMKIGVLLGFVVGTGIRTILPSWVQILAGWVAKIPYDFGLEELQGIQCFGFRA